jgi:RND superfamily putative drug exporter
VFTRLGRGVTRTPWIVIAAWAILLALFGGGAAWGFGHGGIFERTSTSEFVVPNSQSQAVADMTASSDDTETAIVVVTGIDVAAENAALATFAANNRGILNSSGVTAVNDPFEPGAYPAQALLSADGQGYAVAVTRTLSSGDEAQEDFDAAVSAYRSAVVAAFPDAKVTDVSSQAMSSLILGQVQSDLVRGESIGLPVAALLMLIVFGGFIAATMPLIGAISAIGVGMGMIWAATFSTTIDSFILNVVSIIGVALSIDYGLLVVSRFREEAAELYSSPSDLTRSDARTSIVIPAVQRAIATAGRTVTFSAVTIACAMLGLLLMSMHVLKTISLGGIAVTLLAVLAAITLVPALLTVLGRHMLAPSPLRKIPGLGTMMRAMRDSAADEGAFSHLARRVQRHPWFVMFATFAVLVLLALPVRALELRNNFTDFLPKDSQLYSGYMELQDNYPALATPSVQVVLDTPYADATNAVALIEGTTGVDSVIAQPLASDSDRTLVNVRVVAQDQAGSEVTNVMKALRAENFGAQAWVGGAAALQYDMVHSIAHDAPFSLAVAILAVMVLLFLMTGSVLVPLKALIINSLSVLAALGATTFIFEHGWFGVPESPGLVLFTVACMVAFGFGLAMDYEVFLLSRIKEYWDAGDSNDDAVAKGMQRSGRIITSAAAIIIAVFIGFAMGDLIAVKQIGVALAIMVGTDATVTRMLLVPATMTVLGKWNWWAPRPLQRLAQRVGLHD